MNILKTMVKWADVNKYKVEVMHLNRALAKKNRKIKRMSIKLTMMQIDNALRQEEQQ